MKNAILIFLAFLLATQAKAYDFESNGLYFNITGDNTVEVTYPKQNDANYYDGFDKPTGELTIPDKVKFGDPEVEYNVVGIGGHAFDNCSELTAITIPESVTSIEDFAFSSCCGLTTIELPENVTSNGKGALFIGCSNLESIILPNGITNIGDDVFSGCTELKSLVIPESVVRISFNAFRGCNSLKTIYFNAVKCINVTNGNFQRNHNYMDYIETGYGHVSTNQDISAFSLCPNLSSVVIGDRVKRIPCEAFKDCKRLKTITIPNSIEIINDDVFYGCDSLLFNEYDNALYLGNEENPYVALVKAKITDIKSCVIPNGCKFICGGNKSGAFMGCGKLQSIDIPNTVIDIGWDTFIGCAFQTIAFPNSLLRIGHFSFAQCSNLVGVIIPSSVTRVESEAFWNCNHAFFAFIPKSVTGLGINDPWYNAWNDSQNIYRTTFPQTDGQGIYYCEAPQKPKEWRNKWHIGGREVWGCKDVSIIALNGYRVIDAETNNPLYGDASLKSGLGCLYKSTDGSLWYNYGGTATLTATPIEGHHFVRWDDDDEGNTDNPRTVSVTKSRTYTAVFEPDEPTALTTTAAKLSIRTIARSIVVENPTADVEVYDVAGHRLAREACAPRVAIAVGNSGMYVVKCGDAVERVLVK